MANEKAARDMKRVLFGSHEVEVDDEACRLELWREEPRHPETLEFLYKQLSGMDSPVFLDIGAGQGRYTLLATLIPDMKVFCWEPNPTVFGYLESNVRLNGLESRVTPFNCGLWKKSGRMTLHVPLLPWRFRSATMGDHPHKHGWKSVEVLVERLDSFQVYFEKVSLIKLDVEGAEWMVLRGGRKTIKRWMPPIWMESVDSHAKMFGYKKEDPIEHLKTWGYRNFELHPPHDVWITR